MSNISFFHIGVKPKATEYVIQSVRKHHPEEDYYLLSDGNERHLGDLAMKYNCQYAMYNEKLGGPTQPFGYDKQKILSFLFRFYNICYQSNICGNSHIVMLEDDVIVTNPITVNKEWQMACHNITTGNEIPESVIDMIEKFSGKRPLTNQYGAGGGSIFNVKTFIDNYDKVFDFFDENSDYIMHNLYPTFGWIDCFMVIYFMLCGKDYERNPHLIDTNAHWHGFDYDGFVNNLKPNIQIVNNYKKYYYE